MRLVLELHGHWLTGLVIYAPWLVICVWALVLRLARAEETPVFWRAVSVAQIVLALQVLLGLVLLARWLLGAGAAPVPGEMVESVLHVLYGSLFPLIVLVVGHRFAHEGRWHPHTTFALVGLVNFGLLFRAWQSAFLG